MQRSGLTQGWLRSKAGRGSLMVGVAVLSGLGIGVLVVPGAPLPTDKPPRLPEVRLLGAPLGLNDQTPEQALGRVRRYASGKLALVYPDGREKLVSLGRLGAEIDRVRLAQLVKDSRDRTSPLAATWRSLKSPKPVELPVPITINPERALPQLLTIKDEVDRLPADARLDLEQRKLVPETLGRLLDVDRSLAAIEQAIGRGQTRAVLEFEERKPKRLAKDLGNLAFDAVLGYFETRYSRAQKDLARAYNLRIAATKLDGTVLLPGEVFDFNEVVGPRDEGQGYKVAPVIAEGELVDGIGGGTCQISGTLHGAAFFAGLDIVERSPHTRPSSYIKMGLDAAVVYPTLNLRFRNPFGTPVVLHEVVKNGIVRAEILGNKRTLTVTYTRKIDSAVPYEQVERPDKNLPEGTRLLGQRGVPGFKLHRYRILREGSHAARQRWNEVYPPTTQIVRVGVGEMAKASVRAEDDAHPEYLADELLTMTQGPAAQDANDDTDRTREMQERREPGRFGEPGWTEAAGMPFWQSQASDEGSGEGTEPNRRADTHASKRKTARERPGRRADRAEPDTQNRTPPPTRRAASN